MAVFADRVQETSTTTGTGTLTLAGAVLGFQSFESAFPAASTPLVPYAITDAAGNWETGHGTFNLAANTLTRTVVASSNANALVAFAAGTKQVLNALLGSDYEITRALAASSSVGINVQTGTTYTLTLADASVNEVQRYNIGPNTTTIPPNSSVPFPIGAQVAVRMTGPGQSSVNATAPALVVSLGNFNLKQTGAIAVAIQIATDVWQLTGELQPLVTYKTTQTLDPSNSTTAGTMIGIAITSSGTVSHPTQALTNLFTAIRRIRWATATTAASNSGWFETVATKVQGNAAGLGGYTCVYRFGISVNVTGNRCFVGLGPAAALAGDPSSLINMIGVGFDAADVQTGNWFLMRNDATGSATKLDLGSGAARNITDLYKLTLRAPANGAAIFIQLVNETNNVIVYDSSFSADIPANTVFLAARAQANNGALTAAMQLDFAHYDAGMQE